MKDFNNSQVEKTIDSLKQVKSGDVKSLDDVRDKLLD